MPTPQVIEKALTLMDALTIISSVASLILAIAAITLSIVFYRMTMAASNATTEAAKGIGASVERLEKLFDKLYSDTFSMMRDTVSDMRKHMWPTEEAESESAVETVEKKADEKINELKKTMEGQVSKILETQRIAEDKVMDVRREMRRLIDRAIVGSRQVETEARKEAVREEILRTLRILSRRGPTVSVTDIMARLMPHYSPNRIFMELDKMRMEGLISPVPDAAGLSPNSEIRLVIPSEHSTQPNT